MTPDVDTPQTICTYSSHLSRCCIVFGPCLSLWSNFNSEWLGDTSDIAPLLTWILMHADSHIHTHEQLVLHHTNQAQHWHKLKRASQRHIAQHTATAASNLSTTPLSPLSANLVLSPLSPSSSLKRVKPLTDSQMRHRFTSVHNAHKAQEEGGRGKENQRVEAEVEAVVRRVKAAVNSGSGVKGDGGSASKGVKFAEQAIVIGHGHVPVNDKATKKQLLKEKDRQQPAADESHEVEKQPPAVLPTLLGEPILQPAGEESAKIEEETKEQPAETAVQSQPAVVVTHIRKQADLIDKCSPELVLPSLSSLLQSVNEDDDCSTVKLHIEATSAVLSPTSSPVPPPPPPPSPAVAQSPPPSRLSPFLQFHPSLSDHPYHQTLTAYQSLQSAATTPSLVSTGTGSSVVSPLSAPSLPPRKRPDAPPALAGGVVRFRVDSESDSPLAIAASTAPGSSLSAPLSPAPSTPHSASLVSPPPLPPRRPALPTSTPVSAPRTTSAAASSFSTSAMVGVGSGAFRYVIPGQLPTAGNTQPKHRRQRSNSVDMTGNRRIQ